MCVFVSVRSCVRVCERERWEETDREMGREIACACGVTSSDCAWCVCVRERQTERDRQTDRWEERERDRETDRWEERLRVHVV